MFPPLDKVGAKVVVVFVVNPVVANAVDDVPESRPLSWWLAVGTIVGRLFSILPIALRMFAKFASLRI